MKAMRRDLNDRRGAEGIYPFMHFEGVLMSSAKDSERGFELVPAAELAQVNGGAIRVMVDGRTPATMDDLALNMEIFMGNIALVYVN
jgi:hypothetical protein